MNGRERRGGHRHARLGLAAFLIGSALAAASCTTGPGRWIVLGGWKVDLEVSKSEVPRIGSHDEIVSFQVLILGVRTPPLQVRSVTVPHGSGAGVSVYSWHASETGERDGQRSVHVSGQLEVPTGHEHLVDLRIATSRWTRTVRWGTVAVDEVHGPQHWLAPLQGALGTQGQYAAVHRYAQALRNATSKPVRLVGLETAAPISLGTPRAVPGNAEGALTGVPDDQAMRTALAHSAPLAGYVVPPGSTVTVYVRFHGRPSERNVWFAPGLALSSGGSRSVEALGWSEWLTNYLHFDRPAVMDPPDVVVPS